MVTWTNSFFAIVVPRLEVLSAGALCSSEQRSLRQFADHAPLKIGGTAHGRCWLRILGGKLGRLCSGCVIQFLAPQRILRALGLQRCRTNIRQPDSGLLYCAVVIKDELNCHRCRGKISDFAFHFEVSAAAPRWRNRNTNL